jgi:hypothetical protein
MARWSTVRLAAFVLLPLALTWVPGATTQNPAQEVREYLVKTGFPSAEIDRLDVGEVLARAGTTAAEGEILTVGAVKIRTSRDRVLGYYGQMISFVDGQVTLAFGRFSTPPALDDVKSLTLDRDEIDSLRACRPGRCDLRLSGVGIEAVQSAIDWKAPDRAERVNEHVRTSAIAYVTGYLERGDAALVTYDDRSRPIRLADQWRDILAGSTHFHEYSPDLKANLDQFPKGSLPGARDILYWTKESYGLKPIISIVHGVIYDPPGKTDRSFVVQKQIYANHYYDGSLAVATLLSATDTGAPATYLIYANRSRGDMLRGGFGGLKRNMAESQARKAALETLGAIKRALER